MIIVRTPLRVSFLGGGTDYPDHFKLHGGQTLGAGIDKYSYITVKSLADYFDHTIKVSYSRLETVRSIDELQHPAVREALRFCGIERGVEIGYIGDLPARTGLGSSSSFTVALLHALHAFKGELVPQAQLAAEAVHVEQELVRERVGVQDQYTCAHGGLVHLNIHREGRVDVSPLPMSRARVAELESHLMLLYTGMSRHAHEVLEEQCEKTQKGQLSNELGRLGALVTDGIEILTSHQPVARFGELLHEAWLTKRKLSSKVSSERLDAIYEQARQAGAIGGKLLGAGGGGFFLMFAPPDKHARIEAALAPLKRVPFSFESGGSSILFYRPS